MDDHPTTQPRASRETLAAHIGELARALKRANGMVLECQATLVTEREQHAKELAIVRARAAGSSLRAAEVASRAESQLSCWQAGRRQLEAALSSSQCEAADSERRYLAASAAVSSHECRAEEAESRAADADTERRKALSRCEELARVLAEEQGRERVAGSPLSEEWPSAGTGSAASSGGGLDCRATVVLLGELNFSGTAVCSAICRALWFEWRLTNGGWVQLI